MTKTQNYNLNKPAHNDPLRVADFNENADKIDAALAAKAEKSAVTAVESALGNKANAADLTALSQSISAMSTALGSGGSNCRIATGSYVGTGTYGVDNPNTLTFDFMPQLVWFASNAEGNQYYNGFFVRPCIQGKGLDGYAVALSWLDNGVSWYCTRNDGYDHSAGQNNSKNVTYYWIAISST